MASIFDQAPSSPFTSNTAEPVKRSNKREFSLTATERRIGARRLFEMVELAFDALVDAMENGDRSTSVKAAQILLDRAGFGPKSTVDVNTTHMDLSELSKEELAARAEKIHQMLRTSGRLADAAKVIDIAPITKAVN